jgi:glycosyltransferase involved in cell wall biosynthesis
MTRRPSGSPLRVLSIGHSYAVALNRAVLRSLATDTSFDVTVAAPRVLDGDLRRVRLEPEPAGSRLRVVALDATFTRHLNLLEYEPAQLATVAASRKFDVVMAWAEPWTLAARQVVRVLKPRQRFCFYTFHNLATERPSPFAGIEAEVVERADRWLASTEDIKRVLTGCGYPARLARVVPPAVDLTRFRPNRPGETRAILTRLGLNRPVIGFAGRLVEEKGLGIVMQALERQDRGAAWSWLIMGSGPCEKTLSAWARRRRWTDRVAVRLLKHDAMPRHVAALDMLLAPSRTTPHWREQFGRVVIEAFASGVPAVVSDSGALPFVGGDAVKVVGESDVNGWSRAIATLLADPDARTVLSQRGLVRARQFSAEAVAGTLASVFREMCP